MSYSVIRRRGTEETTSQSTEAVAAVRILRDWAAAYPQQYLMIRDEHGTPVAYRRPRVSVAPIEATAQRLSL
ncbi:MAG: hypothetical protein ACYDCQ_00290 [Dehalococcoidia bacterium]